ncbi:MAG TPA: methyltransferase domain-containing protein [Jiangellaceae bacterium]
MTGLSFGAQVRRRRPPHQRHVPRGVLSRANAPPAGKVEVRTVSRSSASLGQEAGHPTIMAWAQEMTCWFALTQGRYRQVSEAARAGRVMAPNEAVSVQLAGQEAKASARMGDRRQVELALERGRVLLESRPYPDNLDNHFTVDPDKFDFYAMDCHRRVGEDAMATMHAHEVIRKSTAPDGSLRSPMRAAEAHTTLAVVSARAGDLDGAIEAGTAALEIPRQSLPSLLILTSDLVTELRQRYTSEPGTSDYVERIGARDRRRLTARRQRAGGPVGDLERVRPERHLGDMPPRRYVQTIGDTLTSSAEAITVDLARPTSLPRTGSVAAMPAPRWFFRFMYDRESTALERRHDEPEHRELVERTADELANVVAPPGPVADLGCGPGAHALALARRGFDVVGVDGSPRMVEVARTRAARDEVDATFDVHDVSAPLRFADASLGGVLAILVLQHLPHPAAFIAEIRRCLRPGGHLLITAPARDSRSLTSQNLYWRLRAACYHLVPGVVRFYDTSSLPHLVEDQGLTVVECNGEPGRVTVLARA